MSISGYLLTIAVVACVQLEAIAAKVDNIACKRLCGLDCSGIFYCDVDFTRCSCKVEGWFIAVVVIVPLLCIGAGVAGCVFCCCKKNSQASMTVVNAGYPTMNPMMAQPAYPQQAPQAYPQAGPQQAAPAKA